MPDIEELKKRPLPNHVAIIMDGNGRWAKNKGLPRTSGHKEGLTVAKKIVGAASRLGIPYVTLYTFSTENWKRTEEEVGFLMNLILTHLRAEFQFYKDNKIKVEHLGDITRLPENVRREIINVKNDTKDFTGTTCVLAINYGGRDEIIRAVKKIANSVSTGGKGNFVASAATDVFSNLTESDIAKNFDIENLPDVDLMIRTGGEKRLSNFLIWSASYAELVFSDTLWPDYDEEEFFGDIEEFQNRERRFGNA